MHFGRLMTFGPIFILVFYTYSPKSFTYQQALFLFLFFLHNQGALATALPLVFNRQQLGLEHLINTVRATIATAQSRGSSV